MEVAVRFIGAIQLIISWLMWPYYLYISRNKKPLLPPIRSPLLQISAVELARKIRYKEIKSRSVVEAYIQRIRDVNPILNAIVEDRFAEALKDADKVDEMISSSKLDSETIEKQTPLLGVPFTVKESCKLKGLSYCVGSYFRQGIKADDDGEAVKNVLKAGGIPLAVTATPEYCMSWETSNLVTGVTNNPYNIFRTPGGSSGGEGALIGSAASVIGVGSDIAGSIRIPSMYNCLYGHKPTPGIIPSEGHFPSSPDKDFSSFLVCGPIARYVDDLQLLFKVMAGESASSLKLDEEVDISKLNIYYKLDAGFSFVSVPVDKEIKQGIRDAVNFLKKTYNCKAQEPDLKELEDSVEISSAVLMGMDGIPTPMDSAKDKESYNLYLEILKTIFFGNSHFSLSGLLFMLLVKHNLFIPKDKFKYYCKQRDELKRKFNELLKDNGVFIYPTHPIPAIHHNETLSRAAGLMYTMLFNVLHLPSTNVPIGLDRNGLPIGFQVIAAEKQDRLCLAVAKTLDARFGGWVPPPSTADK